MIKQNYIHLAQIGLYYTLPHLQIFRHIEGGFTQAADVLNSDRVKNNCHARNVTCYSSTSYVDWGMRPFEWIAKLENTYVVSCHPSQIISRGWLNIFKWELKFQGTGTVTSVKWISAFILEHLMNPTVKYWCLVFWHLNIEYMPLAFEYFHFAFECLNLIFEHLHLVLE